MQQDFQIYNSKEKLGEHSLLFSSGLVCYRLYFVLSAAKVLLGNKDLHMQARKAS